MANRDLNLLKWIALRFKDDEPFKQLRIHHLDTKELIETFLVNESTSEEQLVEKARDRCEDEANNLGGNQRYILYAYHGKNKFASSRYVLSVDAKSHDYIDPEHITPGAFSEDMGTTKGQTQMIARHAETIFAMGPKYIERSIASLERQNAEKDETIKRHELTIETLQRQKTEFLQADFERQIKMRREAWWEQKREAIFDQVLPMALPLLMAGGQKLLGGRLPMPSLPNSPSQIEMLVKALFSNIDKSKLPALIEAVGPGGMPAAMQLMMLLKDQDEAEEKKIVERGGGFTPPTLTPT